MAAKKQTVKRPNPKVRVGKIIEVLKRTHPDAKLDLDFANPLELLIALILAAQARDDLVNQVTRILFAKYRNASDYARAAEEQLQNDVRKVNFYRNKTKLIQRCCAAIVARFDGRVPDRLDDLLNLPGVGRKTANILLGNAFGRQAIGVDTHVLRLAQRLGLTRQSDPDKVEADLLLLVPENQRTRFCHLLQYHGRRICFAKSPRCPQCALRSLCPFPAKTKS
jgi:endonuclease III